MKTKNDKIKEIFKKIDTKGDTLMRLIEESESECAIEEFNEICILYNQLLALSIIPDIINKEVNSSDLVCKIIISFREILLLYKKFSYHYSDYMLERNISNYLNMLGQRVDYNEEIKSEIEKLIFEGDSHAQ